MKIWTFHQVFISWRLLSSFDNELSIIRLEHCAKFSLFWSIRAVFCKKRKHELGNERTVKAKEYVLFRLQAAGYKRRSHTERLSTVLCWCTIFSLSSSILGRIWWHPFPFRVSPRDSLIYCLSGMPFFWRGFCGISKNLTANGHIFFFFFLIENLWNICP